MAEAGGTSAPDKKDKDAFTSASIKLVDDGGLNADGKRFQKIKDHLEPTFEEMGATLNGRTVLSNALKYAVLYLESQRANKSQGAA